MPTFLLEESIGLLSFAVVSSLATIYLNNRKGAIKLPVYNTHDTHDSSVPVLEGGIDSFDISLPVDWIDGEPIKEELFWSGVSSILLSDHPY